MRLENSIDRSADCHETGAREVVAKICRALALAVALLGMRIGVQAQAPDTPPTATSARAPEPEMVSIPVAAAGAFGGDVGMVTQLFRPSGAPPFPVVVFSHGRSGDATTRSRLRQPISLEQLRYWLSLGFAVVAPIRPGYGATGGPDREANGTNFDQSGACTRRPDFRSSASAGKKAIAATVAWLRTQAWADAERVLLVGQSVGGMLTVAAAADRPPGVVAYINFAGGSGGDPDRAPGRSCDPQQLTLLYSEFGKTTEMPNLWIYAENDQYWGPEVPKSWHAAFAEGGSKSLFVLAPPVADGNGHGLSGHSRALWERYVDPFVSSLGIGPQPKSEPQNAPMK